MNTTYAGNYPLEQRSGEIERLLVQSQAMASDTLAMLERLGPMLGWECLDIGCGPGGITDLLGARVGPAGRVVGLDMNPAFLEYARRNAPANVEFCHGDAYTTNLPGGSFDLVHMRFVATPLEIPSGFCKKPRAWRGPAASLRCRSRTARRLMFIRRIRPGTG
jgi:SAM-dependent methyltransferase